MPETCDTVADLLRVSSSTLYNVRSDAKATDGVLAAPSRKCSQGPSDHVIRRIHEVCPEDMRAQFLSAPREAHSYKNRHTVSCRQRPA
ncbi:hypothetical protein MTO96_004598 [Rhipicephalus appendiculatus]